MGFTIELAILQRIDDGGFYRLGMCEQHGVMMRTAFNNQAYAAPQPASQRGGIENPLCGSDDEITLIRRYTPADYMPLDDKP